MNATPFDPGPLAPVDGHRDGDRWTLVFVRDLPQPPETVWAALTEPAQLRAWAPYTADRDLGRTGPATLTMLDAEGREDEALPASVRRAEPGALLEHTWGDDLLRWELAAHAGGTRLTLRHTVAERATLPMIAAGWHLCLVVADALLAGEPVEPIRAERAEEFGWEALRSGYADKLGVPDDGPSPADDGQ